MWMCKSYCYEKPNCQTVWIMTETWACSFHNALRKFMDISSYTISLTKVTGMINRKIQSGQGMFSATDTM